MKIISPVQMPLSNRCALFAIGTVIGVLSPATAHAQGHVGDVGLDVATNGQITTHEITSGGIGSERRVFRANFGDTGIAAFTSNPGFDALPSTFSTGYRIGFNIRTALLVWNGTTFEPTDPAGPLAGERLKISFITSNVTSNAGSVPGFSLAVQSDGGWHRHLSFNLLAATGTSAPTPGIYLLELELWSNDPGVLQSKPLWMVMNHASTTDAHDAAAAWVIDNFLPNPCPADVQTDGVVNGQDLAVVLSGWGGSGAADIDGSGIVDGSDLTILLGAWGECP